jgi:hypothetical protein
MEGKRTKHGRRNERTEGIRKDRKQIVEVTNKERKEIEENWWTPASDFI